MNKIILTDSTNPQKEIIHHASTILSNGGLVIIPTETVYGVACDPNNNKAIKRLQKTKGREKNKPISCLCSSIDQVKKMWFNPSRSGKYKRQFVVEDDDGDGGHEEDDDGVDDEEADGDGVTM